MIYIYLLISKLIKTARLQEIKDLRCLDLTNVYNICSKLEIKYKRGMYFAYDFG